MASIEKRGKNSYRLVVELGYDANGKRIRRTKTVKCKTKKEAEKELAKFIVEVEAGEYISPEKMIFKDFVENEWLKKFAEKKYSPRNLKNEISRLNAHILPVFGHLRLDQIKTIHIVNFLDELHKPESRKDGQSKKLSGATILNIYKTLKSIFSKATEWRLIPKNPMDGVERPKAEKRKMRYFDEEEARAVILALYKEPDVWRLYFLGAMLGGFRRGELLALEWPNVDFEKNTFYIEKSIPLTENGEPVVTKPKTDESEGIVVMPEWYMQELKNYYHEWKKQKLQLGDRWEGGDRQYVFHNGFGKPYHYTTPTGTWSKFLKRHGFKHVRLHDLRHTAATLLIEAGADLKAVQERLRHTKYQTTADFYAHITKKVSKETASKLEKFDPKKFGPQSVPN
ncbi:tyrosine-type recombinase/integrase [Bacillaceae bacterium]